MKLCVALVAFVFIFFSATLAQEEQSSAAKSLSCDFSSHSTCLFIPEPNQWTIEDDTGSSVNRAQKMLQTVVTSSRLGSISSAKFSNKKPICVSFLIRIRGREPERAPNVRLQPVVFAINGVRMYSLVVREMPGWRFASFEVAPGTDQVMSIFAKPKLQSDTQLQFASFYTTDGACDL